VPIPPYIRQAPRDEAQYQTIYARSETSDNPLDSAAAPTAGLHFTPQLMANLRSRGVQFGFVTLAVGLGTFRPIQSETLEGHQMHAEEFEIAQPVADAIAKQRERGARVIAVGTTAARVLESVGDENGLVKAQSGATQIFITPGYRFKVVDALLTNFHLPRSSLLAMVGALAGLENIRYAYSVAVEQKYRFFSFGDAMLIE
jgi:S-adenosylmethionine:tRNA ribosyltransferase-isomerase